MEKIIAYYCAPALAGIKSANIFSCGIFNINKMTAEIKRLNTELNIKGIYIEPLYICNRRIIIMVYRKKVLMKTLEKSEHKEFLKKYGYGRCTSIQSYISVLKNRLNENEYPHEIGIFLGYPLHDIYGYLYKNNNECLLCGEWKVYKNVNEARKLFYRFDTCRMALIKKLLCGKKLSEIFVNDLD